MTSAASGQTAEEKAAARQLAVEGIKLADKGDCKGAVPKLERANKLYPAPTILGRLGECHVLLGRLVLGTEMLARVERETLAPDAPAAFAAAKTRAAKVRREALPKIGKLVVQVTPADVPDLKLAVDGQAMSAALVGVDRPTDPGSHEVTATATGYQPAKKSVKLAEGQRVEVKLELVADPGAAPAAAAPVAAPPPSGSDTPPAAPGTPPATPPVDDGVTSGGGNPTLGFVVLGIGAAGLGFGVVTGVLASGKKSDLDDQCPNNRCPSTASDDLDSAKQLATMSTVGFGVGAAGVVVGSLLLLSASRSSDAASKRPPRRVTARPFVGVGSVGVTGSF